MKLWHPSQFRTMWLRAGFVPAGVRMVGFAHGSPTFKPVYRKVTA